ncbi:FixH family protein [Ectobacillus sp. sgz5001026]|uniref:FixH family protein n=1 Tax=Ectobacillus sp. sgz5001026 TaxID=3242473 RepID=UPI0036D350B4
MKKVIAVLCISLIALVACNSQGQNNTQKDFVPKEVKVEVKTNPETLKSNEKIELQAIVTQDGKAVDDAQDVKFETWKDADQNHTMTVAQHKQNGIYVAEITFAEDGVYHIIAHTNARDMHVMPEVKVIVGNAAVTKDTSNDEHDHSDLSIRLMADSLQANATSKMMAHVEQNGSVLTGATVEFEMWKDGNEKHEFVPAKEGMQGEYNASPVFKEAGSYHVKVHVEKDQLHDHMEQFVEVK